MKKRIYSLLVVLSFVLYGNSISNDYSLDDVYITSNKYVQQGLSGIPDILTQRYGIEKLKIVLDYRPVTLLSAAIEYQFFGANPHISHFINILLYALILIVLYRVLITVFKLDKIQEWLPLIIVFLYAVHPLHTEVVDSIKNRDELFSLLFGLLFLNYSYLFFTSDENRFKFASLGIVFLVLSLLSKLVGVLYLPILILILLYDRLLKFDKRNYLFLIVIVIIITSMLVAVAVGLKREFYVYENALVGITDLSIILPTCFKIIFYHIKMLIIPFPLRYYYGNNMFPLNSKIEPVVIISIILHIGLLIFGIVKMFKKDILGLFIMCYLVCLLLYFNYPIIYVGMFSERALFVSSIWFISAIAIIVLRINRRIQNEIADKIILLILFMVFIAFSYQTIQRNLYWKNFHTLASHDAPNLENSIGSNFNYANLLFKESKETTDSIRSKEIAEMAVVYYQKTIKLFPYYPGYYLQYANLLRYQLKDYNKAVLQYKNVLALDSNDASANYELGKIYFDGNDFRNSYPYFKRAYNSNPTDSLTLFYFGQNALNIRDLNTCYKINKEFLNLYPDLQYPYLNLGIYYSTISKDDSAIIFLQKAVDLGYRNSPLLIEMSKYYKKNSNMEKENRINNLLLNNSR